MTDDALAGLPVGSLDELAGVVDLFGALTRAELAAACAELAYRRGETVDDDAVDDAADAAVARYHLVEGVGDAVASGEEVLAETLVVGPVAFPTLPPDAEDLPHILDVPTRTVDRTSLARHVEERLRGDAARAVAADDDEAVTHLLDVTYDLEAWGGTDVDVSEVRERLDDALQD